MKALYALIPALALAGALAGCDRQQQQPKPQGSAAGPAEKIDNAMEKTGQAADDTAITAKVKMALVKADNLKSGDISVETSGGQVTLTGTVPDASQAQRAASVAADVAGVRKVDNKLTVKAAS